MEQALAYMERHMPKEKLEFALSVPLAGLRWKSINQYFEDAEDKSTAENDIMELLMVIWDAGMRTEFFKQLYKKTKKKKVTVELWGETSTAGDEDV